MWICIPFLCARDPEIRGGVEGDYASYRKLRDALGHLERGRFKVCKFENGAVRGFGAYDLYRRQREC